MANELSTCHHDWLCLQKQNAYDDLHELAEVHEGELHDTDDECEEVECMLEKVMKYGTYGDVAEALTYFINYTHAANELREC